MDNRIDNRKLIAPFIAIIAFLAITGGLSYAYFEFVSASGEQSAFMNTSFPAVGVMCTVTKACQNKSGSGTVVAGGDCAITGITTAMMSQANCSNDTPKATHTAYLYVTATGTAGSTCTVNLNTYNASTAFPASKGLYYTVTTRQGTDSFVALKAKTSWAKSTYATGSVTTIPAGSTTITRTYKIDIEFYNLCGVDQTSIAAAEAATKYRTRWGVATIKGSYA